MITCLGRIVGVIKSANVQDLCNQCAEFLFENKYLLTKNLIFQVENVDYVILKDWCDDAMVFYVNGYMYISEKGCN